MPSVALAGGSCGLSSKEPGVVATLGQDHRQAAGAV